MKLWFKYLLGSVAGILLAVFLPYGNPWIVERIAFFSRLSLDIGRYALSALVLFTVPVAVFELHESRLFWKLTGRTLLLLALSSILFSILGIATGILLKPARIPLLAGTSTGTIPGIDDILRAIIPESIFSVLNTSGTYLLPLLASSLIIGLALCHDAIVTKPVLTLFDSFSRVFYQINSFIAEFAGILLIPVTAQAVMAFRHGAGDAIYRSLLITVSAELFVTVFILLPLVLVLFAGKRHPYRTLSAMAAPALASLVSGDVFFSMGMLKKHAKESLGIRRRCNALTIPVSLIAGRVGSVLITSTTFVVIITSYSNLGLSTSGLLWMITMTPLVGILVGASPQNGTMTALMVLCSFYGKGFDNGYLLIAPVALPLIAAGSCIDTLWAGCISVIIAHKEELMQEKESRFFI